MRSPFRRSPPPPAEDSLLNSPSGVLITLTLTLELLALGYLRRELAKVEHRAAKPGRA